MKNSIEKHFSRTILAASIAAIGVAIPLTSRADESADEIRNLTVPGSQVEIGIGEVSKGSFKYGDYGRGLERSGGYLIGNIQMIKRGDNNANYLEIVGRNLGLDGSRDIRITGGEQGNYRLSFEYDELSKLYSDNFQSPYNGLGTTTLTQGSVVDGANPAAMVNLTANMKQFNIDTRRQAATFGLTKQLTDSWDFAVNYKRDQKDGNKLTGAPIQIGTGGSRGVALIPEPVNYTTDLFDASARYADEKKQMQFAYHASVFDNANRSLTWDNLYTGTGNTTGRLGLAPDNQFHQLSASGSYKLSKETRLTGKLSLGRMTQNEAFLPYQTNGDPMPTTNSLNGKVNTTHLDIKLNTKLTPKAALTVGYKYDDRDNRTPINQYDYYTADRNASAPAANNANRRWNAPLSKTQQMLYADMDYELTKMTKLKFGYDYNKNTRNEMATSGDQEHTLKAEVKHNFNETTSGRLAYAHSDRNAEDYNGSAGLASTYSADYLRTLCNNAYTYNGVACTGANVNYGVNPVTGTDATFPWIDTPAIRKFFLADRQRDKLNAFANFAPTEKLDLQFGGSYYVEKYQDTESGFGLTEAAGWSANFDATLAATDKVSGTFFTTFEEYSTDVRGHNGGQGVIGAYQIGNLEREQNNGDFLIRTADVTRTDRSLTLGLGLKVKQNSSFDWGGNYMHATTHGLTAFKNLGIGLMLPPNGVATGAVILPLPDTVTRLNRLDLFGKYKVQKDLTLNMRYAFEKYKSTDWAWDGQTLTSSTSLIGTGQTSPRYAINAVGVSLTYSFK